MRFAALLMLLGTICPLAAVGAPDDQAEAPHTNIRKLLLSEYKYAPPKDSTQPAPFLAKPSTPSGPLASTPLDPDLVRMAPFTVRESLKMDSLHADIVMQKAGARTDSIMRKLGIGVHVAPVGPVGFYAVTVFYIPIAVGFGFSF